MESCKRSCIAFCFSSNTTKESPTRQPRKRLPSFYADRPIEAPGPKAGLKKIPKPTIMELIGKRPGASAAPTTRTPGSCPLPCRDPFRWARAGRFYQEPLGGCVMLGGAGNTANSAKMI